MPTYKTIRLSSYDYSEDGAYFVTITTAQKALVILPAYKVILKRELKAIEKRFVGVKVDYYVFMNDHCHIIFTFHCASATLAKVIQAFKSITAVKIRRSGFTGKYFWQRNYYEHIIRNDAALHAIREYIRQNPEKERVAIREVIRGRRASSPTTVLKR